MKIKSRAEELGITPKHKREILPPPQELGRAPEAAEVDAALLKILDIEQRATADYQALLARFGHILRDPITGQTTRERSQTLGVLKEKTAAAYRPLRLSLNRALTVLIAAGSLLVGNPTHERAEGDTEKRTPADAPSVLKTLTERQQYAALLTNSEPLHQVSKQDVIDALKENPSAALVTFMRTKEDYERRYGKQGYSDEEVAAILTRPGGPPPLPPSPEEIGSTAELFGAIDPHRTDLKVRVVDHTGTWTFVITVQKYTATRGLDDEQLKGLFERIIDALKFNEHLFEHIDAYRAKLTDYGVTLDYDSHRGPDRRKL